MVRVTRWLSFEVAVKGWCHTTRLGFVVCGVHVVPAVRDCGVRMVHGCAGYLAAMPYGLTDNLLVCCMAGVFVYSMQE